MKMRAVGWGILIGAISVVGNVLSNRSKRDAYVSNAPVETPAPLVLSFAVGFAAGYGVARLFGVK